jgi:hypothetical protein
MSSEVVRFESGFLMLVAVSSRQDHLGLSQENPVIEQSNYAIFRGIIRGEISPTLIVSDFMKKPRIKWNFEMVFGVLIFLVLGLYYVVLFGLFLFVKYF